MTGSSYIECATFLNRHIREDLLNPEIMIICGSGLSGLSKNLAQSQTFNYEDIPGFPRATVPGHHGELVFGYLGGLRCMCMRGRFHFYEGNSMDKVVFPVRVGKCLGVKLLLVTNAAGGLNPDHNVGDIVIIQDHVGFPTLTGQHPCTGINDNTLGPRFFPTSDAYDPALQDIVINAISSIWMRITNTTAMAGSEAYFTFFTNPTTAAHACASRIKRDSIPTFFFRTIPVFVAL